MDDMTDHLRDTRLAALAALEERLLETGAYASRTDLYRKAGVGNAVREFVKGRALLMTDRTYEKLSVETGISVAIWKGEESATDPPNPDLVARVTRRLTALGMPEAAAAIAAEGAAPRLGEIDRILSSRDADGAAPVSETAEAEHMRAAHEAIMLYPPEEREAVIRLIRAAAPKRD